MAKSAAICAALLIVACKGDDKGKAEAPPPVERPAEAAPKPGPAPAPGDATGQRPPWITSDEPGSSACRVEGGSLDCVGVSNYAPDRSRAEKEAVGHALDKMAEFVARQAAAVKAGRPWTPNDATAVAPEEFMAARRAIDAALGIGPASPPVRDDWWWEEYEKEKGQPDKGSEHLVFVRVKLPADKYKAVLVELSSKK